MASPRTPASPSRRPAVANPEQEPDVIIGEFHRKQEIGKGSFAAVYLAQHRTKKSYVAVKAVQMSMLTKKLKENLESEIRILKSLQHPHIVALFTCTETPMYIYLVMEYCQLSDLAQFMKKRHDLAQIPETADIFRRYPNPTAGGLNEVLARHFLKQIASALEYLRVRNLIHRDIKPQNLLLNPAPSFMSRQRPEDVPLAASEHSFVQAVGVETLPMLKIADFGFARHLPSTSMAETLCGSPLYMAPEILRYEKYDARADLWSTGTVLHEMVVGKPPFRAQNHVELLRRIEKANDQILFDNKTMTISRGMKDVIRKLLKKSPLDRVSYEEFFADPVVTGEIPGLAPEDRPQISLRSAPDPHVSELSRRVAKQALDVPAQARLSPDLQVQPRKSRDEATGASRKSSNQDLQERRPEEMARRKSSAGLPGGIPIPRQPSHRQQRRPSIVAHNTAPAREGLHIGHIPGTSAPRMERRTSRASPLAGPPMVREPTGAEASSSKDSRAAHEVQEQAAQDVAFEKEYVMIEKQAVEVNAFADELEANSYGHSAPGSHGALVRRATTHGRPTSEIGGQASSPSRGLPMLTGRSPAMHQRAPSFERPYARSPQHLMAGVLKMANNRIFGTSPPYGKGPSPPRGFVAYPPYPSAPQGALLLGDINDKIPMDEDSKIARIIEEAAHRSDVIFGFAEVKYKQLVPATPLAVDPLGIQQIGAHEKDASGEEEEDKDMTTAAIVDVAEEALVLYVKTLAILAKTINLASRWWNNHSRGEVVTSDPKPTNAAVFEAGKRMNLVVQWTRNRFNECLEKCEVVGRKLQSAQRQLPADHPAHPDNQASSSTGNAVTASAERIQITSGITAERLMFERAVEMSRAAAVSELVNDDLADCEIGYITAIMLLEAVLETDEDPLMRRPSAKKDKPADEILNGMETEDRQTVIQLIEGARGRLNALRRKIHAAHQFSKRSSLSGNSSNATFKQASTPSPAMTPALAGTPPR
ncbi:hypothetical protein LTR08_006719 [Meristemomyces frigidus]|nr:hypothetical protein LTR08_006719 [Meristemomyces frigidus]